jgi:hypothetical protein
LEVNGKLAVEGGIGVGIEIGMDFHLPVHISRPWQSNQGGLVGVEGVFVVGNWVRSVIFEGLDNGFAL